MGDLRLKYEDVVTPIKLGNYVRSRYAADLCGGLETWSSTLVMGCWLRNETETRQ